MHSRDNAGEQNLMIQKLTLISYKFLIQMLVLKTKISSVFNIKIGFSVLHSSTSANDADFGMKKSFFLIMKTSKIL